MTTSEPSPHEMGDFGGRESSGRRWRRTALCVGGGIGVVVVVGATVAITLAVTHDSAARENLIAYLRGRIDGHDALVNLLAENGYILDPDEFF